MKSKPSFLRAGLFSIIAITLLLLLFLPFLCDTFLLPKLVSTLPFTKKELSLSRITPWQVRGTLRLGQSDGIVASIPKFELHYRPLQILQGHVDTLLIDGASLELRQNNGSLSLADDSSRSSVKTTPASPLKRALPFIVDTIVFRDSILKLQQPIAGGDFLLNGRVQLKSTTKEGEHILHTIVAHTDISGTAELSATITAGLSEEEIHISTQMNIPNMHDICRVIALDRAGIPGASVTATGEMALSSKTFKIKNYSFDATAENVRYAVDDLIIELTDPTSPILLSVTGNGDDLSYALSNVSFNGPQLRADYTAHGTVQLNKKTFDLQSTLYSSDLKNPFELSGTGSYAAQSLTGDLLLESDTFSPRPGTTIGPLQLRSNIRFIDKVLSVSTDGNVAYARFHPMQLGAEDIGLDLFFQYPLQIPSKKKENSLTIAAINYKGEQTAKLTASFIQKKDGIEYHSNLISALQIPGTIECTGQIHLSGAAMANCQLSPTIFDTDQLPGYMSLPEGTSVTGTVSANSRLTLTDGVPSGQLNLALKDATLVSGESSINAINTTLHFPEIPSLQSSPSQLLTVGAVDSGKVHIDEGKIFFRIENEEQLFLEKAKFRWCGGKIETGSLALNRFMDSFEATLYCDRLKFAELLGQFGIEDTDGEGSLNGRLPVAFDDGKIIFDDGFLFSTPGNSGIVRFSDTQQLRQGIPDIGQSATLDYSIKALENFAYNWTKLTFNTEGENLLLALQLDGKPAKPLPFGYKNGQIVATQKGPGLQHPVRLDMNFRLPLQELFQYGTSLQSMMENM